MEAASNLSICINFLVLSFVMTYNNKKFVAIFGCNVTFVSQTSAFHSINSPYLKKLDLSDIILDVSEMRIHSEVCFLLF